MGDVKKRVDARLDANVKRLGSLGKQAAPQKIDVPVISHQMQRFAVWFGGSMLSSTGEFFRVCHTRQRTRRRARGSRGTTRSSRRRCSSFCVRGVCKVMI